MIAVKRPEAVVDFYAQVDYWAACVTHFFIDFLNNGRSLIMALLALSLGLSNGQVGLILVIYNIGNALTQPFFGMLSDRIGPRRLVVGGIAWMIIFSVLTAVVSDWVAVVTLTVAGLGSGAFHPAGTMVASQSMYRQRNRATAIFFMFGTAGLFVGPIVAGYVLEFGRIGYLVSAALAGIALLFSFTTTTDAPFKLERQQIAAVQGETKTGQAARPPAWSLILTVIGYSSIGVSIMTYMPILLLNRGQEVSYAGWVSGIYLFGGMFGNLFGGWLADQMTRRNLVIVLGMAGAILPLWFAVPASGMLQLILFFAAGFASAMPHSVLVLLIQSIFPAGRGFASGLALGSIFFTGSLFSYVVGIIADHWDMTQTLQSIAILPLIAAVSALFLSRSVSQ